MKLRARLLSHASQMSNALRLRSLLITWNDSIPTATCGMESDDETLLTRSAGDIITLCSDLEGYVALAAQSFGFAIATFKVRIQCCHQHDLQNNA